MKLFLFGVFAILGLGSILIIATQTTTTGSLTFAQVEREQTFYTDWNPCFLVKCGPGIPSQYIGNNPDTDAMQCLCPNGLVKETRDRTPKRIHP